MEDKPDFREAVSNLLDGHGVDDLAERFNDMVSMTKLKWAMFEIDCPGCGKHLKKRVQVETPDYRGQLALLKTLDEIGKGKPKESAPTITPEIADAQIEAAVLRVLERLTNDRLESLVGVA